MKTRSLLAFAVLTLLCPAGSPSAVKADPNCTVQSDPPVTVVLACAQQPSVIGVPVVLDSKSSDIVTYFINPQAFKICVVDGVNHVTPPAWCNPPIEDTANRARARR